ncbi:MAG: MoaD/ThiS family protein [Anaerolineaceae bacterium]|jgi:molybdopterin converting factor small subunit
MKLIIPSQLLSYTHTAQQQVEGSTLAEVLADLDRQFPGIRFRIIDEQDQIRPHIRIFVNREIARGLDFALQPEDEIRIIGAISGG